MPADIWQAVVPTEMQESVVCLTCFTRLADEKCIPWDQQIEFYPVSMATHLGIVNGGKCGMSNQTAEIENAKGAGMKCAYEAFPYRTKGGGQSVDKVLEFVDTIASRLISITASPWCVTVWYWKDNSEAAGNVTEELVGTGLVEASK